jgi:hypothetical protein
MPFKSKAQMRACFAEKSRNPGSKWDCKKWLREGGLPKKRGTRKKTA